MSEAKIPYKIYLSEERDAQDVVQRPRRYEE